MIVSRGEHIEILPYGLVETETLRIETKTHWPSMFANVQNERQNGAVDSRQARTEYNPNDGMRSVV
jgi:hypothetical protein